MKKTGLYIMVPMFICIEPMFICIEQTSRGLYGKLLIEINSGTETKRLALRLVFYVMYCHEAIP